MLRSCEASSSDNRVFINLRNIRGGLIESFIIPIHVAEVDEACSLVIALLLKR